MSAAGATERDPLIPARRPDLVRQSSKRRQSGVGQHGHDQTNIYGEEEGKTELDWRREQRKYFLLLASFAFTGMLLALFENEVLWYSKVGEGVEPEETVLTHGLKFGVVCTTIASLICLFFYYDSMIKVLRAGGVEFSPGFSIISLKESRLLGWFCIDLLCLVPQPMPFIHFTFSLPDVEGKTNTVYTADSIMMALMFFRLIYLPRFVAEVSILKKELAFRMAKFYNVDINTWVIMRSLLSSDLNTLLFFVVVAIFGLSYILLLVERPHIAASGDLGHGLDEFETCVWVTVITLTTVGLGDVVPATKLGRVAIILNSFAGIAFYALVVNIIVANVQLSPQETRIVEFVKRVGLTKNSNNSAAKVIQTCWRQYKINCKALSKGRVNTMVKVHPTVRNALFEFRYNIRKVKSQQLDRDAQLARSVFDLQATAAGMERQLAEVHDRVVGGGGGGGGGARSGTVRGAGREVKKDV